MSREDEPNPESPSPERIVSPAVRRKLQQCFEQASKLVTQKKADRDYANTLLLQCVTNDPGNLIYVEAFLDNLQQKYDNNKKGARIKGFGGRGPFKKAVAQKSWIEVLRMGPDILKTNPWDVPALRAMAQACEELGFNEAELRYLKSALDGDPKNADVNRHCADSLARMGQFDQAVACLHRVEELLPKDKEATKLISLMTEDKARVAAGMPPEWVKQKDRPRRESPPSPDASPENNEEDKPRREIPLTQRQKLERAIIEQPADIGNYLKLSDLLRDERRSSDAERVLVKALSASGHNLQIQEQLEDVQIEMAQQQLAISQQRAEGEPTEQAQQLVSRLRDELNRRELEVYARRVGRYPNDSRLKIRLAVCLKQVGNYAEAVKYLLKARDEESLQVEATLEMAECLQYQKKFKQSLECYARTAELATDDTDSQKLALYRAGLIAGGMKMLDEAEAYFSQLLKLDAAYRDAKARLDKVRQIRHKE